MIIETKFNVGDTVNYVRIRKPWKPCTNCSGRVLLPIVKEKYTCTIWGNWVEENKLTLGRKIDETSGSN